MSETNIVSLCNKFGCSEKCGELLKNYGNENGICKELLNDNTYEDYIYQFVDFEHGDTILARNNDNFQLVKFFNSLRGVQIKFRNDNFLFYSAVEKKLFTPKEVKERILKNTDENDWFVAVPSPVSLEAEKNLEFPSPSNAAIENISINILLNVLILTNKLNEPKCDIKIFIDESDFFQILSDLESGEEREKLSSEGRKTLLRYGTFKFKHTRLFSESDISPSNEIVTKTLDIIKRIQIEDKIHYDSLLNSLGENEKNTLRDLNDNEYKNVDKLITDGKLTSEFLNKANDAIINTAIKLKLQKYEEDNEEDEDENEEENESNFISKKRDFLKNLVAGLENSKKPKIFHSSLEKFLNMKKVQKDSKIYYQLGDEVVTLKEIKDAFKIDNTDDNTDDKNLLKEIFKKLNLQSINKETAAKIFNNDFKKINEIKNWGFFSLEYFINCLNDIKCENNTEDIIKKLKEDLNNILPEFTVNELYKEFGDQEAFQNIKEKYNSEKSACVEKCPLVELFTAFSKIKKNNSEEIKENLLNAAFEMILTISKKILELSGEIAAEKFFIESCKTLHEFDSPPEQDSENTEKFFSFNKDSFLELLKNEPNQKNAEEKNFEIIKKKFTSHRAEKICDYVEYSLSSKEEEIKKKFEPIIDNIFSKIHKCLNETNDIKQEIEESVKYCNNLLYVPDTHMGTIFKKQLIEKFKTKLNIQENDYKLCIKSIENSLKNKKEKLGNGAAINVIKILKENIGKEIQYYFYKLNDRTINLILMQIKKIAKTPNTETFFEPSQQNEFEHMILLFYFYGETIKTLFKPNEAVKGIADISDLLNKILQENKNHFPKYKNCSEVKNFLALMPINSLDSLVGNKINESSFERNSSEIIAYENLKKCLGTSKEKTITEDEKKIITFEYPDIDTLKSNNFFKDLKTNCTREEFLTEVDRFYIFLDTYDAENEKNFYQVACVLMDIYKNLTDKCKYQNARKEDFDNLTNKMKNICKCFEQKYQETEKELLKENNVALIKRIPNNSLESSIALNTILSKILTAKEIEDLKEIKEHYGITESELEKIKIECIKGMMPKAPNTPSNEQKTYFENFKKFKEFLFNFSPVKKESFDKILNCFSEDDISIKKVEKSTLSIFDFFYGPQIPQLINFIKGKGIEKYIEFGDKVSINNAHDYGSFKYIHELLKKFKCISNTSKIEEFASSYDKLNECFDNDEKKSFYNDEELKKIKNIFHSACLNKLKTILNNDDKEAEKELIKNKIKEMKNEILVTSNGKEEFLTFIKKNIEKVNKTSLYLLSFDSELKKCIEDALILKMDDLIKYISGKMKSFSENSKKIKNAKSLKGILTVYEILKCELEFLDNTYCDAEVKTLYNKMIHLADQRNVLQLFEEEIDIENPNPIAGIKESLYKKIVDLKTTLFFNKLEEKTENKNEILKNIAKVYDENNDLKNFCKFLSEELHVLLKNSIEKETSEKILKSFKEKSKRLEKIFLDLNNDKDEEIIKYVQECTRNLHKVFSDLKIDKQKLEDEKALFVEMQLNYSFEKQIDALSSLIEYIDGVTNLTNESDNIDELFKKIFETTPEKNDDGTYNSTDADMISFSSRIKNVIEHIQKLLNSEDVEQFPDMTKALVEKINKINTIITPEFKDTFEEKIQSIIDKIFIYTRKKISETLDEKKKKEIDDLCSNLINENIKKLSEEIKKLSEKKESAESEAKTKEIEESSEKKESTELEIKTKEIIEKFKNAFKEIDFLKKDNIEKFNDTNKMFALLNYKLGDKFLEQANRNILDIYINALKKFNEKILEDDKNNSIWYRISIDFFKSLNKNHGPFCEITKNLAEISKREGKSHTLCEKEYKLYQSNKNDDDSKNYEFHLLEYYSSILKSKNQNADENAINILNELINENEYLKNCSDTNSDMLSNYFNSFEKFTIWFLNFLDRKDDTKKNIMVELKKVLKLSDDSDANDVFVNIISLPFNLLTEVSKNKDAIKIFEIFAKSLHENSKNCSFNEITKKIKETKELNANSKDAYFKKIDESMKKGNKLNKKKHGYQLEISTNLENEKKRFNKALETINKIETDGLKDEEKEKNVQISDIIYILNLLNEIIYSKKNQQETLKIFGKKIEKNSLNSLIQQSKNKNTIEELENQYDCILAKLSKSKSSEEIFTKIHENFGENLGIFGCHFYKKKIKYLKNQKKFFDIKKEFSLNNLFIFGNTDDKFTKITKKGAENNNFPTLNYLEEARKIFSECVEKTDEKEFINKWKELSALLAIDTTNNLIDFFKSSIMIGITKNKENFATLINEKLKSKEYKEYKKQISESFEKIGTSKNSDEYRNNDEKLKEIICKIEKNNEEELPSFVLELARGIDHFKEKEARANSDLSIFKIYFENVNALISRLKKCKNIEDFNDTAFELEKCMTYLDTLLNKSEELLNDYDKIIKSQLPYLKIEEQNGTNWFSFGDTPTLKNIHKLNKTTTALKNQIQTKRKELTEKFLKDFVDMTKMEKNKEILEKIRKFEDRYHKFFTVLLENINCEDFWTNFNECLNEFLKSIEDLENKLKKNTYKESLKPLIELKKKVKATFSNHFEKIRFSYPGYYTQHSDSKSRITQLRDCKNKTEFILSFMLSTINEAFDTKDALFKNTIKNVNKEYLKSYAEFILVQINLGCANDKFSKICENYIDFSILQFFSSNHNFSEESAIKLLLSKVFEIDIDELKETKNDLMDVIKESKFKFVTMFKEIPTLLAKIRSAFHNKEDLKKLNENFKILTSNFEYFVEMGLIAKNKSEEYIDKCTRYVQEKLHNSEEAKEEFKLTECYENLKKSIKYEINVFFDIFSSYTNPSSNKFNILACAFAESEFKNSFVETKINKTNEITEEINKILEIIRDTQTQLQELNEVENKIKKIKKLFQEGSVSDQFISNCSKKIFGDKRYIIEKNKVRELKESEINDKSMNFEEVIHEVAKNINDSKDKKNEHLGELGELFQRIKILISNKDQNYNEEWIEEWIKEAKKLLELTSAKILSEVNETDFNKKIQFDCFANKLTNILSSETSNKKENIFQLLGNKIFDLITKDITNSKERTTKFCFFLNEFIINFFDFHTDTPSNFKIIAEKLKSLCCESKKYIWKDCNASKINDLGNILTTIQNEESPFEIFYLLENIWTFLYSDKEKFILIDKNGKKTNYTTKNVITFLKSKGCNIPDETNDKNKVSLYFQEYWSNIIVNQNPLDFKAIAKTMSLDMFTMEEKYHNSLNTKSIEVLKKLNNSVNSMSDEDVENSVVRTFLNIRYGWPLSEEEYSDYQKRIFKNLNVPFAKNIKDLLICYHKKDLCSFGDIPAFISELKILEERAENVFPTKTPEEFKEQFTHMLKEINEKVSENMKKAIDLFKNNQKPVDEPFLKDALEYVEKTEKEISNKFMQFCETSNENSDRKKKFNKNICNECEKWHIEKDDKYLEKNDFNDIFSCVKKKCFCSFLKKCVEQLNQCLTFDDKMDIAQFLLTTTTIIKNAHKRAPFNDPEYNFLNFLKLNQSKGCFEASINNTENIDNFLEDDKDGPLDKEKEREKIDDFNKELETFFINETKKKAELSIESDEPSETIASESSKNEVEEIPKPKTPKEKDKKSVEIPKVTQDSIKKDPNDKNENKQNQQKKPPENIPKNQPPKNVPKNEPPKKSNENAQKEQPPKKPPENVSKNKPPKKLDKSKKIQKTENDIELSNKVNETLDSMAKNVISMKQNNTNPTINNQSFANTKESPEKDTTNNQDNKKDNSNKQNQIELRKENLKREILSDIRSQAEIIQYKLDFVEKNKQYLNESSKDELRKAKDQLETLKQMIKLKKTDQAEETIKILNPLVDSLYKQILNSEEFNKDNSAVDILNNFNQTLIDQMKASESQKQIDNLKYTFIESICSKEQVNEALKKIKEIDKKKDKKGNCKNLEKIKEFGNLLETYEKIDPQQYAKFEIYMDKTNELTKKEDIKKNPNDKASVLIVSALMPVLENKSKLDRFDRFIKHCANDEEKKRELIELVNKTKEAIKCKNIEQKRIRLAEVLEGLEKFRIENEPLFWKIIYIIIGILHSESEFTQNDIDEQFRALENLYTDSNTKTPIISVNNDNNLKINAFKQNDNSPKINA